MSTNDVEASLVRMSRISLTKTGVAAVDEDEDAAVDKDKDDGRRKGRVEGDQDGDISESSHRLLRGPWTRSNPALVTGIEGQQTGQAVRD